ncbi:MAG: AsnC family transcriptional regulator [Nanoarchaeota archaeon]
MHLDVKDRKILHELDKNARISYSEIGKRIRLSKNSVINRIKDLEKEEVILGYNARVNVNSLGYTTYDIYLKFRNTSAEKEQEIIDKAIRNRQMWLVAKVEGSINLSLLISTKTPEEFDRIWSAFYQEFKQHLEVVRIAILLEYHQFLRKYLLDKDAETVAVIARREHKEIDETDEHILRLLSEKARTPLLQIAQILHLTPKTVAARIRRLEKEKIILGYSLNLNFAKMGYTYYKLMISLNDLSVRKQMYAFIKMHKNVVYYDKFIGGTDFEFDLELESFEKFLEFIDQLKKKFGSFIISYDYLNPTIIFKQQYFSH